MYNENDLLLLLTTVATWTCCFRSNACCNGCKYGWANWTPLLKRILGERIGVVTNCGCSTKRAAAATDNDAAFIKGGVNKGCVLILDGCVIVSSLVGVPGGEISWTVPLLPLNVSGVPRCDLDKKKVHFFMNLSQIHLSTTEYIIASFPKTFYTMRSFPTDCTYYFL